MEGEGGPIAPVIKPKLGRVIAAKPQHSVSLFLKTSQYTMSNVQFNAD
jgi:hypothetical protein